MITGRNASRLVRFLIRPCLVLLTFACLWPLSAEADGRIIRIGVYENAPKIFTSRSGEPAGIFIDIIEHIAKQEGWELRYVDGTWAEGLDRLAKGEIDLMPDVAYTAEREKRFSFHKVPVLSSWSQVYARKGSGIQSILDLNKKRIAVVERSVQQEALVRFASGFDLNITLIAVADFQTAFEILARGGADAAVTNRFYGLMHAKKFGLEDTAVIFDPSTLFFAASKSAPKLLLSAIDSRLAKMKKDPQSEYYQSLKRWTSEDVRFKTPLWLQIAGLIAGVALIMSLAGSFVLKHRIDARTRELRQINQEMEQRIAERTALLASANKEQQAIFESAGSGIVLLRDRVIVRCNRKLEEIFGYGPGELAGKPTRILYPDGETYFNVTREAYALMARGETYRLSQQLMRKDGTLFWGKMSGQLLDINDPRKGAVGIIEDITKEHAAAENLRKAKEQAESADRIKSAFLATMSHELRTPLNSIIGFTGILLQGLAGPMNEEQRKQMTMVQNSSRHLLALINDVLDISKIESGQLTLSSESFDLRQSIEKIARMVLPLAEKKSLELRLDIADNVGTITTDQRRLEQVILNVLNNAIKFTERGHVDVSCRTDNGHYLLLFSDTGIGMRREDLPNLFQPFHQIDTGLARRNEGTGLGLSICKKLLDMMGGSILVQSVPGEGSTFTIRLPAQTGGLS